MLQFEYYFIFITRLHSQNTVEEKLKLESFIIRDISHKNKFNIHLQAKYTTFSYNKTHILITKCI